MLPLFMVVRQFISGNLPLATTFFSSSFSQRHNFKRKPLGSFPAQQRVATMNNGEKGGGRSKNLGELNTKSLSISISVPFFMLAKNGEGGLPVPPVLNNGEKGGGRSKN